MRVTGVVKEVQNDNTLGWNVSVDDDPGAFLAISILYLVDGQEAKAEMLRRDVRVSAIGCVTKVDKYVVTFESCVLE